MLLLLLADLYWVRGQETHLRVRADLARARFGLGARRSAIGAATSFAAVGVFLFYNTNILNIYRTSKADRHLRGERERLYKRFERAPQPRIAGITIRVDLFPSRRDAVIAGEYLLRNTTAMPIDSIPSRRRTNNPSGNNTCVRPQPTHRARRGCTHRSTPPTDRTFRPRA